MPKLRGTNKDFIGFGSCDNVPVKDESLGLVSVMAIEVPLVVRNTPDKGTIFKRRRVLLQYCKKLRTLGISDA